jgi:hypothetical protein
MFWSDDVWHTFMLIMHYYSGCELAHCTWNRHVEDKVGAKSHPLGYNAVAYSQATIPVTCDDVG